MAIVLITINAAQLRNYVRKHSQIQTFFSPKIVPDHRVDFFCFYFFNQQLSV
jgi:hypothetical protein